MISLTNTNELNTMFQQLLDVALADNPNRGTLRLSASDVRAVLDFIVQRTASMTLSSLLMSGCSRSQAAAATKVQRDALRTLANASTRHLAGHAFGDQRAANDAMRREPHGVDDVATLSQYQSTLSGLFTASANSFSGNLVGATNPTLIHDFEGQDSFIVGSEEMQFFTDQDGEFGGFREEIGEAIRTNVMQDAEIVLTQAQDLGMESDSNLMQFEPEFEHDMEVSPPPPPPPVPAPGLIELDLAAAIRAVASPSPPPSPPPPAVLRASSATDTVGQLQVPHTDYESWLRRPAKTTTEYSTYYPSSYLYTVGRNEGDISLPPLALLHMPDLMDATVKSLGAKVLSAPYNAARPLAALPQEHEQEYDGGFEFEGEAPALPSVDEFSDGAIVTYEEMAGGAGVQGLVQRVADPAARPEQLLTAEEIENALSKVTAGAGAGAGAGARAGAEAALYWLVEQQQGVRDRLVRVQTLESLARDRAAVHFLNILHLVAVGAVRLQGSGNLAAISILSTE